MTTDGIALGLQIVPTMGSAELIDTIVLAEELAYSYCMVADEGLMLGRVRSAGCGDPSHQHDPAGPGHQPLHPPPGRHRGPRSPRSTR